MKRKLQQLSEQTLRDIARNFSIYGSTKTDLVNQLAEYFAAYRISYSDVACRFNLPK